MHIDYSADAPLKPTIEQFHHRLAYITNRITPISEDIVTSHAVWYHWTPSTHTHTHTHAQTYFLRFPTPKNKTWQMLNLNIQTKTSRMFDDHLDLKRCFWIIAFIISPKMYETLSACNQAFTTDYCHSALNQWLKRSVTLKYNTFFTQ